MKISVNLATLSSPRERYALAWAVPLALMGAMGLVAFGLSSLSNYRDYQKIRTNLNNLSRQEQLLKDKETALRKDLDQPQQREVFQKAHFVNGLIEQKQMSLAVLTERVSKLLPPSVRLTSLAVSHAKDGVAVRLAVVAHDEDALETFMGNLEDSPDFRDLSVSNQGPQQAALTGGLVGIVCTARYVGDGAQ